jgi:hypothetical protein
MAQILKENGKMIKLLVKESGNQLVLQISFVCTVHALYTYPTLKTNVLVLVDELISLADSFDNGEGRNEPDAKITNKFTYI